MTLPVLPISRIHSVAKTEVPPGRIVAIERWDEWQVGISVGMTETIHVLLSDPLNQTDLVSLSRLRMERVLDLGAASELLLTVNEGDGKVPHWRQDIVGCIGVTCKGLILCATDRGNNFGDWRSVFISMESDWIVLNDTQGLTDYGHWFTHWDLSMLDAHERRHRIIGNPNQSK